MGYLVKSVYPPRDGWNEHSGMAPAPMVVPLGSAGNPVKDASVPPKSSQPDDSAVTPPKKEESSKDKPSDPIADSDWRTVVTSNGLANFVPILEGFGVDCTDDLKDAGVKMVKMRRWRAMLKTLQ